MKQSKEDRMPRGKSGFVPQSFSIPGVAAEVVYVRNEAGCLLEISANGRTYLSFDDGWRVFDDGFVSMSQTVTPGGILRTVRANDASWCEKYQWNEAGLMTHVDGVDMGYDECKRITACYGPQGTWRYEYEGDNISAVVTPKGRRKLRLNGGRRPVACMAEGRVAAIAYDQEGCRADLPVMPSTYHVDDFGRLWVITDGKGSVLRTFLWDGFFCLGRIDGAAGDPLAAVFSLDCTATPVRIISRSGVTRLHRDAFGESLLAHDGVPGLFGGTVYGHYFHYRSRLLDPRIGYFTAPDPLDGSRCDPRRTDGYDGPLPVEKPHAGPYCVCQNNPVSRADFRGESSAGWTVLMVLSDLTWSLQNNIVGWLGYDGFLSLWGSIFSGNAGRYGWSRGVSSERTGSYGVLRDGVFADGRAKTFQHIVIVNREAIEELADVRVFAPADEFVPTYCGSVLLVTPQEGAPFLLLGAKSKGSTHTNHLPMTWTRYGGPSKPVIPGSSIPSFPKGGFHFETITKLRGPVAAKCVECVAGDKLAEGTLDNRFVVEIEAIGTGIAKDSYVLLSDTAAGYAIARVLAVEERDEKTSVRVDTTVGAVAQNSVAVRRLTSRGVEDLPKGAQPDHLDCTHATQDYYHLNDPLRITQGDDVLSTLVKRFEAEIVVDSALPGDFTGAITLSEATAQEGPFEGKVSATAKTISFVRVVGPANPPIPEKGDFILAISAAAPPLVLKVEGPGASDTDRLVDLEIGGLGPAGTPLSWQFLRSSADALGKAPSAPAATNMVFNPTMVQTLAGGFVKFSDSSAPVKTAIRTVTGVNYSVIVTAHALPAAAGPCSVECFSRETPGDTGPYDNRTLRTDLTLLMNPLDAVENAVALQLHQITCNDINAVALAGKAEVAGISIVEHADKHIWFAAHTTAGGTPALKPSQFVYLKQGADVKPALIDEIRVVIQLTRQVKVGESGVELVPVSENGPHYYAERKDDTHVVILPFVDVGAVKTRVQMPRFGVNEIIRVDFTAPGPKAEERLYRIKSVSGTTCEVEGDDPVDAAAADIKVVRMTPTDPHTAGSRAGIDGTPVGAKDAEGMVTTDKINFKVYDLRPLHDIGASEVAIISGDHTFAAKVVTAPGGLAATPFDYEIYFAGDPPLKGPGIDILAPDTADPAQLIIDTGFAASFRREGDAIVMDGSVANVTAGPKPVVVVPLVKTAKEVDGTLSCGSTLVPDDPEEWEFDRQESLIEHELIHTRQCCWLGPLLTSYIPLGGLEGLFEWTTEAEDPTYSPYLQGKLEVRESDWYLVIPTPGDVSFESGTPVEVSKGGKSGEVELGSGTPDAGFRLPHPLPDFGPGDVYIRRRRSNWQGVPEWIINVLQFLTHGGLMNATVGTVYGGLFFLITRGIYALAHLTDSSAGRYYEATFAQDGTYLELKNDEGAKALSGASRVIVKSGETTVVREVSSMEGRKVDLSSPIGFRDGGQVTPYTTHDPASTWDWYNYYPAQVSDLDQPARISIEEVGGESLDLEVFDRLKMLVGSQSKTTVVMAVDGNAVELKDPPPLPDGETTLRVAKVGHDDAMGWVDDYLMEYFDMGWMKWLFDPYGQIDYQFRPTDWTQAFTRITRYIFGTQSWCVIPGAGFFWHDNAFKQTEGRGHMSLMEQQASEESGDLYSWLSRLRNEPKFVGDIGRFWYFAFPNANRETHTVILPDLQDAPGVHFDGDYKPRLLPLVTGGAPAPQNPNADQMASAASGYCLADSFVRRNWAQPGDPDPTDPDMRDPPSFTPSDGVIIPTSAALERCGGAYVAFTRSGKHRISVPNSNSADMAASVEVQEWGRQKIYYDVDVQDLTVTCGGMPVGDNSVITLLETQQARIRVAPPDKDRRYGLSVTDPAEGAFVRVDEKTILVARTPNNDAEQPVELSRVYTRSDADGTFDDPELNHHKTHFFRDIHVPVRQFAVKVVRDLYFRSPIPTMDQLALDFNANKVSEARPGDAVHLLVPSAITEALNRINVNYPGSPPSPGNVDPLPIITTEDNLPEGYGDYLGDGLVIKVVFPAQEPPQEAMLMTFKIGVGRAGNTAEFETVLRLKPYFMLRRAAGYQVLGTGSLTLACESDPADPAVQAGNVVVTPSQGITIAVAADGLSVTVNTVNAPEGFKTVKVEDIAHAGRFAVRTIEVIK